MTRIMTGSVLRAMPRLGPVWDELDQSISGPLHRLTSGPPPAADAVPPGMLTSWWRLSAVVRAEQEREPSPDGPCPDLCLLVVRQVDVAVLGRGARMLGDALLPGRESTAAAVAARLADSPSSHQRLVVDLACLHGLLDLDLGRDGELLHLLAGVRTRAASVLAAHGRVAVRISRMWSAAVA